MTVSTNDVSNENADALYELSATLLPLWSQHIDAAKHLTNESIEALSLKFGKLSQQIQAISQNDGQKNAQQLVELIQESQRELTQVIDLLKKSIEEKDALIAAIFDLSKSTKSLSSMADIVTRIAKETGMVAVNAAIEAARVGERGRGFAVVAEAVKRLSADAGKTGSHIAETVTEVTKAIKKVEQFSGEVARKDAQTMVNAEQIVQHVVQAFGDRAHQIVRTSDEMLSESRKVGHEIDQVLVSLQFQDRVSQMLTHVCLNIDKLNDLIVHGDGIGDRDAWLDAFQSTYVMREQYQIHAGNRQQRVAPSSVFSSKPTSAHTEDVGEITFF